MRERHLILYVIIGSLLTVIGCAKRIPLSYEQAQPNALVKITTLSGETCSGLIREKNSDYLSLRVDRNASSVLKINRDDIASMSSNEAVYDASGSIISEWEIDERQGNKNFWIYTLGGAGLSFGASFFIGSLINRGLDDQEQGEKVMWTTTAAGTSVGTFLFARSGKKRDHNTAIEEIRETRFKSAKDRFETEKSKRKVIHQELEKEKSERAKQEAEIERLKEQIKKDKKKEN